MTTLVLGLGSPYLTDDTVGIRVAEAVRTALDMGGLAMEPGARGDVQVETLSVGGLALMEAMLGYTRVILVDALQRYDGVPGAVSRMTLDDLRAISPIARSSMSHDTSLAAAIDLGQCMGLPLPEEVVIVAVEVENTVDFGEMPTPAVAAAIPRAAAAVLAELGG